MPEKVKHWHRDEEQRLVEKVMSYWSVSRLNDILAKIQSRTGLKTHDEKIRYKASLCYCYLNVGQMKKAK